MNSCITIFKPTLNIVLFGIFSHPQTRIIKLEILFAKVDFSPLEYYHIHLYYNLILFSVNNRIWKANWNALARHVRTGLLNFNESLVNLPLLKKTAREIKELRKKNIRSIKYFAQKSCRWLFDLEMIMKSWFVRKGNVSLKYDITVTGWNIWNFN